MIGQEALVKLQVGCMTVWEAEECYKAIEKDLEVLEIIKNKRVSMMLIEICSDFNDYNWNVALSKNTIMSYLTETEFDLIKEWLNNGNN